MFPLSTQKKHWLFNDENDLVALREKANAKYIARHGANMTVNQYFVHISSINSKLSSSIYSLTFLMINYIFTL